MYTKNEKIAFARRVTLLAEKTDMPYDVCMALGGEEAKIALLKDTLLPGIDNDLKDLQSSFLFNQFIEHVNIDADTGKVVDFEIPYHYMSELESTTVFDRCGAIQKILRGITGSSILFCELEITELSKRNVFIFANYLKEVLETRLLSVCMSEALKMIDQKHIRDLEEGSFYVRKGIKQLRALWVLKYLKVKEVVIPYGVTVIRPYAFENARIEKITFSRTVSHIQRGAFYGCSLKNIELPENKFLTELGIDAFSGNPLNEICIPANIKAFDFYAFRKTPLKCVTIQKDTKVYHKPKNVEIKEV